MKDTTKRMVIYKKEVMVLCNMSERTASRILYNTRKHFNKPPLALVTIQEFCEFTTLFHLRTG